TRHPGGHLRHRGRHAGPRVRLPHRRRTHPRPGGHAGRTRRRAAAVRGRLSVVQSRATDVATYLAELPPERRAALTRLRELCLAELPGFTEVMAYGMPAYQRDGVGEIAFAAQKQYISFYLLRTDVRDAFADRLAGHDMGKGC